MAHSQKKSIIEGIAGSFPFILITLIFLFLNLATSISQTTDTYTYTGAEQPWIVPIGVSSITIKCYGAQGGSNQGGTAGQGGYATGTLAVTAGQTVYIEVGGQGGTTGAAGWNGGGAGYPGTGSLGRGGGGGASDVRFGGNALSNRVIVAGGGGGNYTTTYSPGGNGGGTAGTNGGNVLYGYGGTQTAGGNGYVNGSPMNGTLGQGGTYGTYYLSGGGGGYYGGGAGMTGGGGSGYIGGVTGGSMTVGGRTGNGYVTITYTALPCNAPISITTSLTPSSSCITPQSVTFNVTNSAGGNLNGGSWEYQWQIGGTVFQSWSATSSYTTSLSASATYTVYMRTTACNSLISAGFNAIYTLNPVPAQPSAVSGDAAPCIGSSQTYSVTNVPGTTYNWTFPAGWTQTGGGTTNSITVTVGSVAGNVQVTPSNFCGDGTPSSLAVIGDTGPAITGTTPGSICNSGTVILSATSATGTMNWWDAPTGGSLLGTGPSYTTPVISSTTTYYVDATLNSCTTVNRTSVIATVNLSPAAPSSPVASPSSMCSGSSSTLSASINIDQTVDWFSTSCGVDPVSSVVTPDTTTTYYAMTEDLNTGCLSTTCVNVTINITPALAAPVFTLGATSTRCFGASSLNYTATAANSTSITYNLDTASLAAGNTINSITGDVTYDAAWTGTSIITATAQGCGGPLSSSHTVTLSPVIGMPIFLSGGTSSVCIGSPPVTFTAVSTGSTGETYYLDAASTAAGNSIDASTGEVTFYPTWTGTMVITVVATGCGGPKVSKHSVTVMPNVDVPVFDAGATSSMCQGSSNTIYTATATNSTGITYSLDATSLAAGNTIDTLTGTVTWNPSWSGSSTITASAAGCSGPTTATHVVTINATTIPVFAGTTQSCAGVTGNLYSVQTGMTNYIWTVSTGGTITSGGTTSDNTATIIWNTSGVQTVNVSFTNSNSCTSTTSDTVHVDPLNVAVIAGSSLVCVNSTGNVYSTQPGMTNYIWNVSSGGTVTSGGTTTSDTIIITWNTTGNQTVSVNYTNSSGCSAINPTDYTVAVDTLPVAAGSITGPSSICQGATGVVFSVNLILNSTGYTWTLPAGATIVSGANTNSITVDFSGSASSGSVSVQGTNSCGNGDVSSLLSISLNSIPSNPVITLSGDTLTSSSPTGNQWYQNGILIIGATSQTYVASSTGHYWDVVTVSNCVSDSSNHIYIVITGFHGYSQENNVDVFPNPNNGSFTISMNFSNEGMYNLSIFNVVGMKVYELNNFHINGQTKKNIDLGSVPAGVYNLVIENNGFKTIRKIVVL